MVTESVWSESPGATGLSAESCLPVTNGVCNKVPSTPLSRHLIWTPRVDWYLWGAEITGVII